MNLRCAVQSICSICMEPVVGRPVCSLRCGVTRSNPLGHQFHGGCFVQLWENWRQSLAHDDEATLKCPTCRTPVTESDLRRARSDIMDSDETQEFLNDEWMTGFDDI